MALRGTIRDFGVADVFQLIGQQRKTGILRMCDDVDDVSIFYRDGLIIHAESKNRPKALMLGMMLVNAGLLSEPDLKVALSEQSKTLQRLGPILVDATLVDETTVNEFARLQMTETIYRLFLWTTGTYEFNQVSVDPPAEGVEPIPAEHILMEGVRMIDEWPEIRRCIPEGVRAFRKLKPLPRADAGDDGIEPAARRLHELIDGDRNLSILIHRSRLGEFETCRLLVSLIKAGFIEACLEEKAEKKSRGADFVRQLALPHVFTQVFGYAALFFAAVLILQFSNAATVSAVLPALAVPHDVAPELAVAESRMKILRRAIDAYKVGLGQYPPSLDALVDEGFVSASDIRFPFSRQYIYRIEESGPVVDVPSM